MSIFSKKSMLAIDAVLYLAYQKSDKAVRASEICSIHGVTLRYLEGVLQQLVKAGIMKGIRGAKGGYVLAKDRRKITLEDIIVALEECTFSTTNIRYYGVLSVIENQLMQQKRSYLSTITIQDICDQLSQISVASSCDNVGNNFSI